MLVIQIFILLGAIIASYFIVVLCIMQFLANFPRRSVDDSPDWGFTKDLRIRTINGKKMECWVVYPQNKEVNHKPAIILIHGWGRNRGRMVSRARIYGKNGYITILISVRDHGNSDKEITGMSIVRFSQDLDSCVRWWGKPVIISGHSIGAGAALIVAAKNPLIRAVIAEATPYAFPHSLKYVYRPVLKWLTPLFLPGIKILTLFKFRSYSKEDFSPLDAAPFIKVPTLLIHGKDDVILPSKYIPLLQKKIIDCITWIPEKTDHHNIEEHPEYKNRVISFLEAL
ncbi:MAG: alpha/beta hydrolase [Promethearchaeota archaeon]